MEIDWEKLWSDARKDSVQSKYRKDVVEGRWDITAEDYRDSIQRNDYEYGRNVISVIKDFIEPDFEVLDIGAGPGTLTIPIARLVNKVTVVDPSKGMIKVLEESATATGIENIKTINRTWQEIDDAEIREKFDLVITSNVLWQFDDVGEQLMRMHKASRKYCLHSVGAGSTNGGVDSDIWVEIMNKEYPNLRVDYIYIYNILHSKGIHANIKIIDSSHVIEKSVNDAIGFYEYRYDLYTEITPRVRELIKDYVLKNAVNGIYRRESKVKSAVMWWKK